jgi:magnesium transporter
LNEGVKTTLKENAMQMTYETEEFDKDFIIEELQQNIHKAEEYIEYLKKIPAVEVADILFELDEEDMLHVFKLFNSEHQAWIFPDLSNEQKEFLFHSLNKRYFAKIVENMDSAARADFFQDLDKEEQILLLPFLNKATRDDVIHLSSYPPETAGGIMNSDFATIFSNMTVQEAIQKIRKDSPSKKMIYYCYVVDDEVILQGFITLKGLIMSEQDTKVKDIMHEEFVFASVDEDRESVASKIEKYDLVAIPVVNSHGQLLGIVTHDDAIEIIRAEHTEDLEKFMGITGDTDEFDYEEITVGLHYRKRLPWLVGLLVFGICSGMVIQHFSYAIEKIIVLALFMPMIAATGGNVGSQAASVIIRAMALGQVTKSDWWKVVWKESRTSLLLGFSLGIVGFINVFIIAGMSSEPQPYPLYHIAIVISIALTAQVISASMIGAVLPLFVKRLGGDPAVVASPAITSLVDVTGLLIYFGITTSFFLL